jgi:energy-coupling factor transporter ATP-binding protein EcfA2
MGVAMRITRVYVRFYKSFNYDYERKFAQTAADPWDYVDGAWYPYVRLDLEASVTTIVGANESGKSHLLDSIEKLITGERIELRDFCRYSHFFSVEEGKRRTPDFGGEFELVSEADVDLMRDLLGADLVIGARFHLFRSNGSSAMAYLPGQEEGVILTVEDQKLAGLLPAVFRLDANVPLPASIPLHELTTDVGHPSGSRRSRRTVVDRILGRPWSSLQEFAKAAPELYSEFSDTSQEHSSRDKQYQLGRDLLLRVARIDPTVFRDLANAIADEQEGYVNAIIQKINLALAAQLNFPRWWAQDREFRLMISPREYELVFTIRDRTGTDYSFSERSNGLRYFLSYHVQLLAHESPSNGRQEILLMDEPDAYLSSQGQQDLLRILEEFAQPEGGQRRDQVAYVTHSPFLINRNAGHRIRVLDKGVTDEGTRVVKDVARNHYEPLRSSLGAFVAETAFIGGTNLFVEGSADQVLLAGISSHLRIRGNAKIDTLDLNSVTIVPAGGASSVPYLVYLARGRDVVRPPCVVLLDSDVAGNDAFKALQRGGARRKQILPTKYVVQIGTWAADKELSIVANVTPNELEDLLSLPVAVMAARNYATHVVGISSEDAKTFTEDNISIILETNPGSLFDALANAFSEQFDAHIEKIGFAREVVGVLTMTLADLPPGHSEVERNFRLLLGEISRLMRQANQEEQERRHNDRLKRTVSSFLSDYPTPTTRERGRLLIEDIQASVDDSETGDLVKVKTEKLRREFELDENLASPIDRFEDFRTRIAALQYEERFANQE